MQVEPIPNTQCVQILVQLVDFTRQREHSVNCPLLTNRPSNPKYAPLRGSLCGQGEGYFQKGVLFPLKQRKFAIEREQGNDRKTATRAAQSIGSNAGAQSDVFQRPTDVAWDASGNIYVADGYGNARVAKFDRDGKFVKSWGSKGDAQTQFNTVHGIAIDAQGNVYVADRGNKRIQVFDPDGNFKTSISNVGSPSAICITPGGHQYLYSSNSNPPDDIDANGEIYKLELTGQIVGKFGRAGKLPKEYGTVNAIDCRNENELYVGEIGNWRVQKLTLHP